MLNSTPVTSLDYGKGKLETRFAKYAFELIWRSRPADGDGISETRMYKVLIDPLNMIIKILDAIKPAANVPNAMLYCWDLSD